MLPLRDLNPIQIRPFVTWALIAASVIVYFTAQQGSDEADQEEFLYRNAAVACELVTGEPLSIDELAGGECVEGDDPFFTEKNVWLAAIVSMFLHGGIAHLVFNMWSLWIFGNNVEEAYGHAAYLATYLAAGVAATAGFVVSNQDLTVPLVGASGAIAGVMGAYLVLFPRHLVLTLILFRPVAIPAVGFLGFWFVSQFLLAGSDTGIAWEAHVVGFATGIVVTLPIRSRLIGNTLAGDRPVKAQSSGLGF